MKKTHAWIQAIIQRNDYFHRHDLKDLAAYVVLDSCGVSIHNPTSTMKAVACGLQSFSTVADIS